MADVNDEPGSSALGERTGMPRWVKVSLVVVLALIAIVVIANVTGVTGEHGPRRHGGGGGTPTSVVEDGHRPPVDHEA